MERLASLTDQAIVTIVAPAGYGKTTLLRAWADELPNVAYVNVEESDNDPAALISCIAAALDRVEPLDAPLLRLLASPGRSMEATLLPALVEAIWARKTPAVLMLDDVHRLSAQPSLDAIAFIMLRLPQNLRLALAARHVLPLPYARLRAAGHLFEIGGSDLAIDASAAQAMAATISDRISPDQVAHLLDWTEGWPAVTYLGLRSMARLPAADEAAPELLGTEASIADYMRSELLERLEPEVQTWVRRSSVLETMSGPVCDAVLETTGSLARLRELERHNVFVVGLGSHRNAYRYHRLFRDMLRDDLDEREPGVAAELLARAAAWCAANNEPEMSVEYAHASGDMDLTAALATASLFPLHWSGRIATVARWLDWFDSDGERDRRAALAVVGGWVHSMEGRTRQARQWLASAERSSDTGPMPDGASKEAWVALLRGFMAPAGLATLVSDAGIGLAEIPDHSPFRQTALIVAAFAEIAAGRPDVADELLAEALELSEARQAAPGTALALGERALIALARGDVAAGGRLLERGLAFIRDAAMDEHLASAALHTAAIRAHLLDGSPAELRLSVTRVNLMRPRLGVTIPVPALQMRFEAIRACIVLRDAAAARALLVEVRNILRECPHLGVLVHEAAELERAVGTMRNASGGPWALTAAELRLLAYLPTHLTFREIAARLYVSRHTVKSQAMAIYGKLGVSSRRGAIEQAVAAGLLDASVLRMPAAAGAVD